ncbi:cell division protein ZapD [Imhoffiella purpurea]|uniref:Cell division protein ZapD n=1 Tax=Imhoffiella purpurea TaxID=1249627 RepID=W9VHI6_9GAMM|nr:cell division protein ZapD [Imhoffiella purpurea]EXJ15507.1 hypothetical protein D779_1249 [Imhoffiella purpurea]
MSTLTTYEHPLNERIRTFLRLEHQFGQLDHFMVEDDRRTTRAAIAALLDIIAITARADVKNDIIKELDRHQVTLGRMTNQRGVDPEALEQLLGDMRRALEGIQNIPGPIGHTAREDEFLKGIAQRSSIPGATCSFDLPHFHHWLTQSSEVHQDRLDHWLHDLQPAMEGIRLILMLVRSSGSRRKVLAEGGFFQEALDPQLPAQLLRVALDAEADIFPEISGHKNRFSIRFMNAEPRGRASQHNQDVDFRLTCCAF